MSSITRARTGRFLMSSALAIACAIVMPLAAQKKPAPASRAAQTPRAGSREIASVRAVDAARRTQDSQEREGFSARTSADRQRPIADTGPRVPREHRLRRAASFDGDLRGLPQTRPTRFERPEREGPEPNPVVVELDPVTAAAVAAAAPPEGAGAVTAAGPAPAPAATFEGLDFGTWGNGHPPDTVGDVGPAHYIQAINTALGIFDKATGSLISAFTFNTFMSQGHFGNICDTNNFGDPVILYDTFEDRWVITDFAFVLSAGNVIPPALQCFAVSKTGDPIGGGWNFYSIETPGGLGDYPKFGIWSDGIYMSANMFGYPAGSPFQGAKLFALNKAQMYAGAPSVQVVSFDAPAGDFTLLPANARLQTGTPAPGTPNYFLSTWLFTNAVTVYKFHVDWNRISLSTFTGPDVPIAATSWPNQGVANAPSQVGNSLDVLQIRAMMQNQYSNISGVESLWATHTVRRVLNGTAAPRWYQVNVTGGTVGAAMSQAATWDPDAANVMNRFMPSLAVNRNGDMALGYSTSNATTKPAIKYAGRLAGDPINTFSQTEQTLIQGLGTQTGNCGGQPCTRWGDYSAMSLDPDGCTFWYTNMYYPVDGLNHHTRVGSFVFESCTPATNGSIQGTVKTSGGAPLANATVSLGSRTAITDGSGNYLFTDLPAGTYPSISAALAGYVPQTVAPIAVPSGATAVQDFTLDAAPLTACLVDTTQSDFQLGVASGCDLASSPGNVTLVNTPVLDQQQTNSSGSGNGFNAVSWLGQTFMPGVTGTLTKLELSLFCATCSGVNPDVAVEVRTTAGGLPTSTVLASATIPGFSSGSSAFYTAAFPAPPALTAGTQYAYTIHSVTTRAAGTYAAIFSTTAGAYVNGTRVASGDSGVTWIIPTTAGTQRDLAFRTFMSVGFSASGTFVSSLKDANPAPGATPTWLSIGWTASVPAGTGVRFQAAASDSAFGPFTFVGPDGTAATFFANGGSLAQFNGKRYLKYRALLDTTNPSVTPVLNDVTICYEDVRTATALAVEPATGPYNGTATLTATLTAGGLGLAGKPIAFTLGGSAVGTATTSVTGEATLPNVSLAGITGGVYPGGVTASFAGDLGYTAATGANVLTVTRLSQAITFAPIPDAVATDPPITLTATGGDSGQSIVFSTSSTACSVSGNVVTLLAAGSCTVDADQAGDSNYDPAPTVSQTFSIAYATQTIVFGALPDRLATDPPFTVSATGGGSGNPVVFSTSSTACSVSGNVVTLLSSGTCAIAANQAGDARYSAAPTVTQTFSIGLGSQTIAFGPLAAKTYGAPDFTVTATATSGLPVSFAASGQCTVAGSLVHLTGAGSCSITASQAGDARYAPAPAVTQSFAIARAALTVTAANQVKVLFAPNPPLTGTLSGVVAGDNITATFSTTATTFSPIGLYPIVPALVDPGNRLPNYTVTSVNGVLAVMFAPPGPCFGGPGHQILPPIKTDGSSAFKPNSKVDVQFRVCEVHGIPVFWTDVVSSFKLVKIVRNGRTQNVSIDLEGDSDDRDRHGRHQREFRFDLDDLAWVFHLNTKVLGGEGTYFFRIDLADGTNIEFSFSVKKNARD